MGEEKLVWLASSEILTFNFFVNPSNYFSSEIRKPVELGEWRGWVEFRVKPNEEELLSSATS